MNTPARCPFCGKKAAADTLNYTGGKPVMFRVQCRECKAATAWYQTEEEARAAWNRRVSGGMNFVVNRDTFIMDGLLYNRNRLTGNCAAQKERGGKSVRIKEDVFIAACEECQKVIRYLEL
jgi:Lar family restriction alleviation protein